MATAIIAFGILGVLIVAALIAIDNRAYDKRLVACDPKRIQHDYPESN